MWVPSVNPQCYSRSGEEGKSVIQESCSFKEKQTQVFFVSVYSISVWKEGGNLMPPERATAKTTRSNSACRDNNRQINRINGLKNTL